MKIKNYKYRPRKRRGLSTIVGALLFVVLMVSTFTAFGTALDSQTDIVSVSRDVADAGLKKQQEEFSIEATAIGIPAVNLSVIVDNLGQNSIEISSVVVTQEVDVTGIFPSDRYEIPPDAAFIASGDNRDVLASLPPIPLTLPNPLDPDIIYSIKVISSLGTIQLDNIICNLTDCLPITPPPGVGTLTATLFLDGPNGINTKNSTVVMFVTNTSEEILSNVQPVKGFTLGNECDDMWTVDITNQDPLNIVDPEDVDPCVVDPQAPITLGPHETAIFKWDGVILGDVGAEFEFCSSAQGEYGPGPTPINSGADSCDLLTVINPNDCGGCDSGTTIILIDDLLIRPELFLTIPGPFGLGDNEAVWGVNVVNPTTVDMQISKLTMVAYPPGSNNNDKIFGSPCPFTPINPLTNWSCPKENTLMWVDASNPLTIPASSSVDFAVTVEPDRVAGAQDIDAMIIQANAFTTVGSFGKAGYQSAMYGTDESMASVYLTDTDQSRTDIKTQELGITELVPHTFKVTIADMDDIPTYIATGARLVINVPREWTNVTITNAPDFDPDGDPGPLDDRVIPHPDGSTQIIGVTSSHLGQATDAFTLEFTAIPPAIDAGLNSQLYVMYILADGVTDSLLPVGPLNEAVLQVVP